MTSDKYCTTTTATRRRDLSLQRKLSLANTAQMCLFLIEDMRNSNLFSSVEFPQQTAFYVWVVFNLCYTILSSLQSRVIILDVMLQNYDSLPTENSALRLSLTGDGSLHRFVTFSIRLNYITLQPGKHFFSLTTFLFLPITSVTIIFFGLVFTFYNVRVIVPGSWGHRIKSKRGLRNVVGTKT